MLSLKKCKQILNQNGDNHSDEQVKKIRQFLYQMAEIEYQQFKKKQTDEECNHLHQSKHRRTG